MLERSARAAVRAGSSFIKQSLLRLFCYLNAGMASGCRFHINLWPRENYCTDCWLLRKFSVPFAWQLYTHRQYSARYRPKQSELLMPLTITSSPYVLSTWILVSGDGKPLTEYIAVAWSTDDKGLRLWWQRFSSTSLYVIYWIFIIMICWRSFVDRQRIQIRYCSASGLCEQCRLLYLVIASFAHYVVCYDICVLLPLY